MSWYEIVSNLLNQLEIQEKRVTYIVTCYENIVTPGMSMPSATTGITISAKVRYGNNLVFRRDLVLPYAVNKQDKEVVDGINKVSFAILQDMVKFGVAYSKSCIDSFSTSDNSI